MVKVKSQTNPADDYTQPLGYNKAMQPTQTLRPHLRIAHLYPELMNLYGDRGNILTLVQRCRWRGIEVSVTDVSIGDDLPAPSDVDLLFIGGGQDAQQHLIYEDMISPQKAEGIRQIVNDGGGLLAICGGYQLLGHYFDPIEGDRINGIGLIDCYTMGGQQRLIGNVTIKRPDGSTIVGFENHSGQTFLGKNETPLGHVLSGHGNNGQTGDEGVCTTRHGGLVIGTYLHGSLLPKNPALADELIAEGLQHQQHASQPFELPPLDDALEHHAHQMATSLKQ